MSKCPKCSRRIESFAVDTNCSFRMCSNVDCTWPFEAADMGKYFEHDATVPSMRKRAKKRKLQSAKEDRIKAKKAKSAEVPDSMAHITSWLSDLSDASKSRATPSNSSLRPAEQLTDLSTGNLINVSAKETLADGSAGFTNSSLAAQVSFDKDDWLQSLLAPQADSSSSNGLTDCNIPSASAPLADSLFINNVADIFAALGSPQPATYAVPSQADSSGDAGVPRNSRQASPATSNSESGADDTENRIPLSPDDLAMIISDTKQQQGVVSAVDTSAGFFDPISMLLSPPASANTTGVPDSATNNSALDLLNQYYWQPPSSDSASLESTNQSTLVTRTEVNSKTTSASQLPFDLSNLFNVPVAVGSDQAVQNVVTSLGSSNIIEDIFGRSAI
ncbi:hypothetical protein GGI07_005613 [Coemansia sp. Benny D115]|nr:hypothetical protein GGI07_005613 [Coemansia sp. Benny D115]